MWFGLEFGFTAEVGGMFGLGLGFRMGLCFVWLRVYWVRDLGLRLEGGRGDGGPAFLKTGGCPGRERFSEC